MKPRLINISDSAWLALRQLKDKFNRVRHITGYPYYTRSSFVRIIIDHFLSLPLERQQQILDSARINQDEETV